MNPRFAFPEGKMCGCKVIKVNSVNKATIQCFLALASSFMTYGFDVNVLNEHSM